MKSRIFYSRPDYNLLKSLGQNAIDMHFHTQYSDTSTKVSAVIKKAKKNNFGVAITDHNEIKGSIEASKNKDGVTVIPGIEVSCLEGPHILFYFYSMGELKEFYKKHIEKKKNGNPWMAIKSNVSDVLDGASDYNCLKVAAHPFGYMIANSGLMKCINKHYVDKKVMKNIDCLEVLNGEMPRNLNIKATDFAIEKKKGFTGGTDGHALFQLGNTVTIAHGDDIESFLNNIKHKRNVVQGVETKILTKIIPGVRSLKAHMHYAIPSVKMQAGFIYFRANKFRGQVFQSISEKKQAFFRR